MYLSFFPVDLYSQQHFQTNLSDRKPRGKESFLCALELKIKFKMKFQVQNVFQAVTMDRNLDCF